MIFVYIFSICNILQPLNSYVFVQFAVQILVLHFCVQRWDILYQWSDFPCLGYGKHFAYLAPLLFPDCQAKEANLDCSDAGRNLMFGFDSSWVNKTKTTRVDPQISLKGINKHLLFVFFGYEISKTWSRRWWLLDFTCRLGWFDNNQQCQQLFELYDKFSLKRYLPRVFD